jgi:hypothetical protein
LCQLHYQNQNQRLHLSQKIGFISPPREKTLAQEEVVPERGFCLAVIADRCKHLRVLDLLEDYVEVEEDEVVDWISKFS